MIYIISDSVLNTMLKMEPEFFKGIITYRMDNRLDSSGK